MIVYDNSHHLGACYMTREVSEQYVAGMMRALEIMRAHDKYPDHYLCGIAALEKEIREKVEERWKK